MFILAISWVDANPKRILFALGAITGLGSMRLTNTAMTAFMLLISTPPNAIVYGSGLVPVTRMMRAGFFCNICVLWCYGWVYDCCVRY